jgi:hypothetical protein
MMEWMSRILVGEMAGVDEDYVAGSWAMWLISLTLTSQLLPIKTITIHMDQMILSEPSIIFTWTYQDMMEWMSRILVGEMAGADDYFGVEVGQMWLISLSPSNPTPLQTRNTDMGSDMNSYRISYQRKSLT